MDRWLEQLPPGDSLRKELLKIQQDQKLIEDCFYKDLEFGTGGMRGELGPGTNRMNIYTVRKAAEGLARFIVEKGEKAKNRGVVIAYDSRQMSPEFALEVAKAAGTYGVRTFIFEGLRPTPVLSFAVRYLQAFAGVVITASHNPPEYNGFKVYGEDGGQLTPEAADTIIRYMQETSHELVIHVKKEEELLREGLLTYIGDKVDRAYLDALQSIQLNQEKMKREDLSIVFTPLHGTANHLVHSGLVDFGFTNVTVVKEQELPDPMFSTVHSPNPEDHAAFELAIRYGEEVGADILMATDPDADRLGVAVKNQNGEYTVLTGNQMGALMLHYLLLQKQKNVDLPSNGVVVKTIVTSEFGRAIASDFGMKTIDTLTGFKFIGEKINEFERTGEYTFLFGYEESYGYLIGDFVRDKDAVQSAVFSAEVAAYYKAKGKSLYEGLIELYEKYGFFSESLNSITLKGKDGNRQINQILEEFRNNPPSVINGVKVVEVEDYLISKSLDLKSGMIKQIDLPKSNVLKYRLEDESWFCVRPSGTEPKCKFYFAVKGESLNGNQEKLSKFENEVMNKVFSIVEK